MRGPVVLEAYSEPSRTSSKMKLFARIVNCFQPLFSKIFILDVRQGSEYTFGSLTISKPLIFMLKTARLSSCLNIYLLFLSENFKDYVKHI